MTDLDHDYLNMFERLRGFFEEEQTQLTTIIPSFAAQKTIFDTRLAALWQLAQSTEGDFTGYAADKLKHRERLQTLMPAVGNATIQHYRHTAPDAEMEARLKRSILNTRRQTTADFLVNSRYVWETADAIKTLLGPFGISAAEVDGMGSAIEQYENLRTAPQDQRENVKRQRAAMHTEIKALRIFLKEVMDGLLSVLQMNHSLLYNQYKNNRKLHKQRGKRSEKSPDKVYINAGSTKELVLRKPVTAAEDGLMCISHSKHAEGELIFYYSSTPAGEQQVEGLTIAAGTRQATTAGALGFSEERKHLCVRNTAMQRHDAGVARGW